MFQSSDLLKRYIELNDFLQDFYCLVADQTEEVCKAEIEKKLETAITKINKIETQENNCIRTEILQGVSFLLSKSKSLRASEANSISNDRKRKHKPDLGEDALGRQKAIESTIVPPGKIGFNDVAGLLEVKKLLREAIVMPLKYPHLFNGARKPWRKILLFGPPGTGKSRIARAISSEVASTFYSVSCSDLLSSWFGETEKLIKDLFNNAKMKSGRSIIFIDEIDGLCRRRNSNEQEQTRRIKTELLKQMESTDTEEESNVFILGATNCPWELDSAFVRRFQKRIYIPLPDKSTRKELFHIHLKSVPFQITNQEWTKLLEQSEGYSGSDLSTCVADAIFEPLRELESSTFWKWNQDGKTVSPCKQHEEGAVKIRFENIPPEQVTPRSVEYKDLKSALDKNTRTVNFDELHCYVNFSTFGRKV
ncbi:vacuolar protein sorting-associated protein 4A-like [Rhopilema esculentum]|uniref:vacuolar protein sorting-associated protein 4A-like n=1 Tax=Rhopilema esculentum TaxID=499914 RepID=UPI0031CE59F9|eukprot:gene1272-15652_t